MNRPCAFVLTVLATVFVPSTTANDDAPVIIKLGDSLEQYWIVENKVAPRYPGNAVHRGQEGCATVGYFIDEDGTTSDHWVIASHPKKLFDRSAIEANKKFAYSRGVLNEQGSAVMTINTFTYSLAAPGQRPSDDKQEALESVCKDPAVKALVAQYGYAM